MLVLQESVFAVQCKFIYLLCLDEHYEFLYIMVHNIMQCTVFLHVIFIAGI